MIECAIRADGADSPASEFFDCLAKGMWLEDPDSTAWPDDAQISDRDKMLEFCHHLAEYGEPLYGGAVNYLDDGVWEFKKASKRLSFYDTPGDGTYHPKIKGEGGEEAAGFEFWWFPNFDDYVRLGHAFPKLGQTAGDFNVEEAMRVRMEDLRHDQDLDV